MTTEALDKAIKHFKVISIAYQAAVEDLSKAITESGMMGTIEGINSLIDIIPPRFPRNYRIFGELTRLENERDKPTSDQERNQTDGAIRSDGIC